MKATEEPKKIPYTAETFPMWAVWIRNINWNTGCKDVITEVQNERLTSGHNSYKTRYEDADDYVIAGTDGVWKPFYQEV